MGAESGDALVDNLVQANWTLKLAVLLTYAVGFFS
jgi:hypothetical protein